MYFQGLESIHHFLVRRLHDDSIGFLGSNGKWHAKAFYAQVFAHFNTLQAA